MLYSLPTELNTTSHSQTCRNNGFKITRAAPTASHITPYPGRASHTNWESLPHQESVCLAPHPPCRAGHLGSGAQALLRGYSPVRLSAQSRPTQGASQQRGVYPVPPAAFLELACPSSADSGGAAICPGLSC